MNSSTIKEEKKYCKTAAIFSHRSITWSLNPYPFGKGVTRGIDRIWKDLSARYRSYPFASGARCTRPVSYATEAASCVSHVGGNDIVDGERRFNLKAAHWINIRSNSPARSINPSFYRARTAIRRDYIDTFRAPRRLSRERLCFHVQPTSRRLAL